MPFRLFLVFVLMVCGYGSSIFASHQPAPAPHLAADGKDPSADHRADGPLAIRVSSAAYKPAGVNAWVMLAIEIHGGALQFGEGRTIPAERLEVGYVATDTAGGIRSGRAYDGRLTLDGDAYARASRRGVRVLTWLDLPAGQYELRVTARMGGAAADVRRELSVPDFAAPLTMSGVSMSAAARDPLTISADAVAPIAVPSHPTARREFETGETLVLFTEVYENEQRLQQGPTSGSPSDPPSRPLGDHTTHAMAQLIAEDGTILLTRIGVRVPDPAQPVGRHAFSVSVPLDGVPPGRYVLRTKARANIGGPDTATEDVPIRVN